MVRDDLAKMKQQTITLSGLRVQGTHGVLDCEHTEPQEFVVDVSMEVCVEAAVASDDIDATISYADVADAVVEIIHGPHVDLIETLAERIAQRVAAMGARLVTVTVHKPSAPMEYEFDDVSATTTVPGELFAQKRRRMVIGIGSNLDTPEAHVIEASATLADMFEVEEVSELYRSAPRLADGQEDQPDYVNAVLTCYTDLPLLSVLQILQHIEADHGRVRTKRWEARTLDLDVIDVESVTSVDPELILPHPRAAERRFVVEPWLSIDPTATLYGEPLADILERLGDQSVERMDMDEYMPRVIEAMSECDADDELFEDDLFDDERDLGEASGFGLHGSHWPFDRWLGGASDSPFSEPSGEESR